ncbi:MAG: hypothetical protein HY749_01950 [Gammaproteobacteria bacterium]|nr:hypothetical protein [Gammaproteobacteria bacterium]
MSNFVFPRPAGEFPVQARETVAGTCAECGAAALARHPVLSEGGWHLVVKCQACLATREREPWRRLGHVTLMTDVLLR